MSKFKVGDRVRIVGCESWHGIKIGEFVTVEDICDDWCFETCGWYVSGDDAVLAPSQNTITSGKSYKSVACGDWFCIYTKGDYAWMVRDYGDGPDDSSAYVFKTDGTPVSLSEDCRIVLEPEVTEHEDWFTIGNGDDVGEVRCKYNRVNGKVDWDSLKIVKPCS